MKKFKEIWKVGTTKNKDKNIYFVYRYKDGEIIDIDYDFGDDEQYAKDVAEVLNEHEDFRRLGIIY